MGDDHTKFADGARNASLKMSMRPNHSLQGCVNLFNSECEIDLEDFKKFPWTSTYPTVLELTPSIDFAQEDTPLKLVKEKQKFNQKVSTMRKQYTRAHKRRDVRKAEKKGLYNHGIIGMVNHLESDPDKFFTGDYNWYFTGGILDILDHELYGTVSFWAFGTTLNELRIAQLGTNAKSGEIIEHILTLPIIGEVHQVTGIALENELCAVIRQKNTVTILKSKNLLFDSTTSKTIDSTIPFVSAVIEKEDGDFLYTLDVENNVKKWDIREVPIEYKAKNLTQVNKFRAKKKRTSNWATIHSLSEKYLIYADRQQVKLIDKVQLIIALVFNLDDFVYVCSEICCVALSKFPNLIYVATTHDCFAISFVLSRNKRYTIHLRWTHQLTHYPMLIKTCLIGDNTELIIVSSSISGDVKILCNERVTQPASHDDSKLIHRFRSYYLPYNLKSSIQLYNIARLRGKCLNPTIPTHKRIYFSTSGIGFVKDSSDELKILTANSVGDIFIQELSKVEGDLLACIDAIDSLEQRLSAEERSQRFVSTGVANLKPLEKVFRSRQFIWNEEAEDEPKPVKRRPKWKRQVKELRKYTDILAQDMLAIWEFSDEEDEDKIVANSTDVASLSIADKVGNWLESMHQDHQESQNKMSFVQENEEDEFLAPNPRVEEEEVHESTPSRASKPPQKKLKKKAHVGGF